MPRFGTARQLESGAQAFPGMIELLRTNDIVLISRIEALMAEHEIGVLVADQHMSVLEGSSGFLPRRMLIDADDLPRARMALHGAGLLGELKRG